MGIASRMALVLWLSLMFFKTVHAEFLTEKRETMRGLPGVHVLVEGITNEAALREGITSEYVRMQVELKLRLLNISVLDRQESFGTAGNPYLYVNITSPSNRDALYAFYSFDLTLNQQVTLWDGRKCNAATWRKNGVATVGLHNIRSNIDEDIRIFIDYFANDFHAVNAVTRFIAPVPR